MIFVLISSSLQLFNPFYTNSQFLYLLEKLIKLLVSDRFWGEGGQGNAKFLRISILKNICERIFLFFCAIERKCTLEINLTDTRHSQIQSVQPKDHFVPMKHFKGNIFITNSYKINKLTYFRKRNFRRNNFLRNLFSGLKTP